MKKSLIALGIVAVLGGTWSVLSWQSGKLLEENKLTFTQSANDELQNFITLLSKQQNLPLEAVPKVTLTLESYQRGIFSSKARYYISDAGDKNPKERVYLAVDIEHGPLPLSELFSFHWAPKGAVINIEPENTDLTKELFDVTHGKSPFNLKIIPGTSTTRSQITITPIDYDGFKLDGTKIDFDINNKTKAIQAAINVKLLSFNSRDVSFDINSLTYAMDLEKSNIIMYMGHQQLDIKNIKMKAPDKRPPFEFIYFDNLRYQQKLDINNQNTQYNGSFEIGAVKLDENDLGAFVFSTSVTDIASEGLKDFLAELSQHDEEKLQAEPEIVFNILAKHIDKMVINRPKITINPVSWSNKGGVSSFTAKAELMPFKMVDVKKAIEEKSEQNLLATIVKYFDYDLTISIPMLREMAVTGAKIGNLGTREDAAKSFDEAIQNQLPVYLKQYDQKQLLTLSKDKITSKVIYNNRSPDIVTVNDKQIPLMDIMK